MANGAWNEGMTTAVQPAAVAAPTFTSNRYVFAAVPPTSYTLQISGPTIATYQAPVVLDLGVARQIDVLVDLNSSVVSGQTVAIQGAQTAATTGLNGVTVQIGTVTGGVFTTARSMLLLSRDQAFKDGDTLSLSAMPLLNGTITSLARLWRQRKRLNGS